MDFIEGALEDIQLTLQGLMEDAPLLSALEKAVDELANAFERGNAAYSCGNGGSMCDALHFAEELTGRFQKNRRPLPARAISDPAHLSCVSNDYGHDQVFARYLEAWGRNGDILLAITCSGHSPNVLAALDMARSKGMKTIGLLGKGGGLAKSKVDIPLVVPSRTTHRIQEIHIKLIHILIEGVERRLFPKLYTTSQE